MPIFHIISWNVFWHIWSVGFLGRKLECIFKILLGSFFLLCTQSIIIPWPFSTVFFNDVKQSPHCLSNLCKNSRFLDGAGKEGRVGDWILSQGILPLSEWWRCAPTCLWGCCWLQLSYRIREPACDSLEGKTEPKARVHPGDHAYLPRRQSLSHSSSWQHMSPKYGLGGASQSGWCISVSSFPLFQVSNPGSPSSLSSPSPGLPLSSLCDRCLFLSRLHQSGMTQPPRKRAIWASWEGIEERDVWLLAKSSRPCSPERWVSRTAS